MSLNKSIVCSHIQDIRKIIGKQTGSDSVALSDRRTITDFLKYNHLGLGDNML
jgi:hypothetical protein